MNGLPLISSRTTLAPMGWRTPRTSTAWRARSICRSTSSSLTPFIVIPAFTALIAERFIGPEETMLERAFGAAYLEYKTRVRRWL